MAKIWRKPWLNGSLREIAKQLERGCLGRSAENCARANSAFSGTLWGIFHD
jgi:hypothetical protein